MNMKQAYMCYRMGFDEGQLAGNSGTPPMKETDFINLLKTWKKEAREKYNSSLKIERR
jgi:hypothetical protein